MSAHPAPQPSALSDQEKLNWLRLIRTENVGPITFYRLLERFSSAGKALDALPTLSRKGGRMRPQTPPPMDLCEKEIEELVKLGGEMIFAANEDFPLALTTTEDAPPVLSVIGNKKLLNRPGIGMVGARNASLNGRKFAEKIARDLGEEGQIIISGLARGIDTAAHTGSLNTGTIAVVAGGVDVIYPSENKDLYRSIADHGLVVAESPLGVEPIARHFPKRNRIISGLSSGIVVIEATLKSGSLITARMAGEQGRDVFAVPGHPYDPRAAGPNKLLQDGAVLVQSARDILEATGDFSAGSKGLCETAQPLWDTAPAYEELDEETALDARTLILQNLSNMPVSVDDLIRTCQMSVGAVQSVLLEMELAGRLQRLPGNRVMLLT